MRALDSLASINQAPGCGATICHQDVHTRLQLFYLQEVFSQQVYRRWALSYSDTAWLFCGTHQHFKITHRAGSKLRSIGFREVRGPVRSQARRSEPKTTGRSMYWLEDKFQLSVQLIDFMKMASWELKQLLGKLHFLMYPSANLLCPDVNTICSIAAVTTTTSTA
ncbi:hypothetical protein LSAT2_005889 [Lamellibrachia satsuma]|nr:hypothetical protein LSAT2_005889 [Lamellibrachia satsuma]